MSYPVLRRFLDANGINRFQLVARTRKEGYKKESWDGEFLCAFNGSLYPTRNPEGENDCNNFEIKIAKEEDGKELFKLQTSGESHLPGSKILTYLHMWPSFTEGRLGGLVPSAEREGSRFYLIEEQKEFVIAQLFKSPFETVNSRGAVVPYHPGNPLIYFGDHRPNIDSVPFNLFGTTEPSVWIRIPFHDNLNFTNYLFGNITIKNMGYIEFSNYLEAGPAASTKQQATLFHLVYSPQNRTFALRLVNQFDDHETRWLCFLPLRSIVKRDERPGFFLHKKLCI